MKSLKFSILGLTLAFFTVQANAQKFFSRTGKVKFETDSKMEKIEAKSNTASVVIDLGTGDMEVAMLVKSFNFDKALMQEHFNENYIESTKFPKSSFKGKIINIKDVNLAKDGPVEVQYEGQLTLHGVTKPLEDKATLYVGGGKINAYAKFKIPLEDYEITIPALVKDNIGKKAHIEVKAELEEYKKAQ